MTPEPSAPLIAGRPSLATPPARAPWVPAHLGVVLGTGALALLAKTRGWDALAGTGVALAWAGLLAGGWLVARRWIDDRAAVRAEWRDPRRAPGWFLFPLAVCVATLALLRVVSPAHPAWRFLLPVLALVAAAATGFLLAVAAALFLRPRGARPGVTALATPAWLLPPAAAQALGVLAAEGAGRGDSIPFFGVLLRGASALQLPALAVTLFVHALILRAWPGHWRAGTLRPDQWINAGAQSITALACLRLAEAADLGAPVFLRAETLRGLGAGCWLLAAAWVPFLAAAGCHRHGWRREFLPYEAPNWALVFSPAVFAAATAALASAFPACARPLALAGHALLGFALLAWLVNVAGLLRAAIHPRAEVSPKTNAVQRAESLQARLSSRGKS